MYVLGFRLSDLSTGIYLGRDVTLYHFKRMKCVLLLAQRGGWGELGKCRKSCSTVTTSKFSRQVWCRFFQDRKRRALGCLLICLRPKGSSACLVSISCRDQVASSFFFLHMTNILKKHYLPHKFNICVALVFFLLANAIAINLHGAVIKTRSGPTPKHGERIGIPRRVASISLLGRWKTQPGQPGRNSSFCRTIQSKGRNPIHRQAPKNS